MLVGVPGLLARERQNLAQDTQLSIRGFGARSTFGIRGVRLMTNNPRKIDTLQQAGIEVAERVALQVGRNAYNDHYLDTKKAKLGHLFGL